MMQIIGMKISQIKLLNAFDSPLEIARLFGVKIQYQ
ncbi:hypothetical protein BSPLISOX_130 [uncultured Gammaproteobacteria bacterium]|jgi:hypothetical protein|nr:hypothetical protein [uncultured Gammaproteobacteria bacterium]VVH64740.1 hypothetical protein BSPLISOX_130 [uncultured Gammaproteobacteria bacterium]